MDETTEKTKDLQLIKAQEQFGIRFKDAELLRMALTHKSFAHESASESYAINEKLEFLGDSVLNFVITDYIYDRYPDFEEGDLAKLRAALVNTEVLADKASELRIGDFVFLGKGAEQTGGRERTSILADCFEAVVGSIYLDQGLEAVKGFIVPRFIDLVARMADSRSLSDCKTTLQEMTAQLYGVLPEYHIYREEGPVHSRVFYAEVLVRKRILGRGKGHSKKKAQQQAARQALKAIGEEHQCMEDQGHG